MEISWNDFTKIEMRVGTVIHTQSFPEAKKPAYILHIDFGEKLGIKKTSAQITQLYSLDSLLDKQVVCVVNLPKKQIGAFMSECLLLGAVEGNNVTLLTTDSSVTNGLRIL